MHIDIDKILKLKQTRYITWLGVDNKENGSITSHKTKDHILNYIKQMKLLNYNTIETIQCYKRDALLCTKSTSNFLGYQMLHNSDKSEQSF